jgi:asparagine synthase (glutamine-hydrolysing)
MCGFVAVVGHDGWRPDVSVVQAMTDTIVHRGPDDSGIHTHGSVALGFRRLSILDLAPSGHQPMVSPDGRHVLVFNGEIYNYIELREELKKLGHQFRSTGDSDVLLAAYREWGTRCVERFNGMWAFAILDQTTGTVFGARDRFGVKPLYCHRQEKFTIFASEIKAIRDSGLMQARVNWDTVSRWLLEDHLEVDTSTFLSGITSVPPGTAFEIDAAGKMRSWSYWNILNGAIRPEPDVAAQFRDLFEDAVRLRMRSDVPVGVLLSGGLDSTSIFCGMFRQLQAEASDAPLNAFCFMSERFDETRYINATLENRNSKLHRLEFTSLELWRDVDRHLAFQDEPVHSATSVIGFKLMELARSRGVKVLLNGQGADEVLAGYPTYFRHYWSTLLSQGQFARAREEVREYAAIHGGSSTGLLAEPAERLLHSALQGVPGYRQLSAAKRGKRLSRHAWYRGPILSATPATLTYGRPSLAQELRQSVERAPLPLYLRVEDRNSMASSLEVRLPFLDYRLVSLAFALPDRVKLQGPWNKHLLRESMRGRIPEIVRTRPDKMGFPTPIDDWFRKDWHAPMRELIDECAPLLQGICDTQAIARDLEQHRQGLVNQGGALFKAAQLALWLRQCRASRVSV